MRLGATLFRTDFEDSGFSGFGLELRASRWGILGVGFEVWFDGIFVDDSCL